MDDEVKVETCAWCNKETMLAMFGILLGVMFIALSVDTLRRMRLPSIVDGVVEGVVVEDD